MRLGHAQLHCTPGDLNANLGKVLAGLRWAADQQVEIMAFPESFLTGYFSDGDRARQHSLVVDGPEITGLLKETAAFPGQFMVGFNERRGDDLYNTVLVAEAGRLLGTYSKAFPCFDYFKPGRSFPVFTRGELTWGVVICADGGYVEPSRILALRGARVIFAPHYNYVHSDSAIRHFMLVRADHTARAVENGVWFFRCNNVTLGRDHGLDRDGVGYGDSYLMDPAGEIFARSVRGREHRFFADIDPGEGGGYQRDRSARSAIALAEPMREAIQAASDPPGFFC